MHNRCVHRAYLFACILILPSAVQARSDDPKAGAPGQKVGKPSGKAKAAKSKTAKENSKVEDTKANETNAPNDPLSQKAEALLNAAGLSLTPRSHSYIVEAETSARQASEIAQIKSLEKERRAAELNALETSYAKEKAEADGYVGNAAALREEIRVEALKKTPDRQQMTSWETEAQAEANKAIPVQARMRDISANAVTYRREIADIQGAIDRSIQRNRNQTAEAMAAYARLARDRAVIDAIRTVNRGRHPKCVLGPIEMHDQNLVAAMNDTLLQLGFVRVSDRKLGDLYHLAEETTFIKNVRTASELSREIQMHETRKSSKKPIVSGTGKAGGDTSNKQPPATMPPIQPEELEAKKTDLASRLVALRDEANGIGARRAKLVVDRETIDAVEEMNRLRRPKVRIASKAGHASALKDLEAIERSIPIPAKSNGDPPKTAKAELSAPKAPK